MIPQKIAMGYILTGRHMTAQEAHRFWGGQRGGAAG
jgi:hypothetical protein